MSRQEENLKQDFNVAIKGKFYGVLRWPQLDDIWKAINKDCEQGWYFYEVSQEPPTNCLSCDEIKTFISKLNNQLHQEHDEDYCGIVYVDDLESPTFIKVFDPRNLGTSCSIAKTPPPPKWIISKQLPEKLLSDKPKNKYKKRWFGNLFAK